MTAEGHQDWILGHTYIGGQETKKVTRNVEEKDQERVVSQALCEFIQKYLLKFSLVQVFIVFIFVFTICLWAYFSIYYKIYSFPDYHNDHFLNFYLIFVCFRKYFNIHCQAIGMAF